MQLSEAESSSAEWVVVSAKRTELVEAPHFSTETEKALLRRKNLKVRTVMHEQYFSFDGCNEHLLDSDAMRWILAYFGALQRSIAHGSIICHYDLITRSKTV
jgi:hypothetical protein